MEAERNSTTTSSRVFMRDFRTGHAVVVDRFLAPGTPAGCGYEVGPQGALNSNVVLVGPLYSRGSALKALRRVRRTHPGARLKSVQWDPRQVGFDHFRAGSVALSDLVRIGAER